MTSHRSGPSPRSSTAIDCSTAWRMSSSAMPWRRVDGWISTHDYCTTKSVCDGKRSRRTRRRGYRLVKVTWVTPLGEEPPRSHSAPRRPRCRPTGERRGQEGSVPTSVHGAGLRAELASAHDLRTEAEGMALGDEVVDTRGATGLADHRTPKPGGEPHSCRRSPTPEGGPGASTYTIDRGSLRRKCIPKGA